MKKLNQNLWEKVKTACWSSDHAYNPLLFALLLFLLPTQFGRHFWPSFSFLQGFRLDYLSPTLYVSDVLLVCILVQYGYQKRQRIITWIEKTARIHALYLPVTKTLIVLGFIIFVFLNCFFSVSPLLSIYGWIKLSEMAFFTWYSFRICQDNTKRILAIRWFILGVALQAILAIFQFLNAGSLGGIWYFLGERTFSGATPGIANTSLFGELVLRPYGTLPHPNLLAAFLLVGLYFLLFTPRLFPSRLFLISRLPLILFLSTALLLSLSRVAIVLFLLLMLLFIGERFTQKRTVALLTGLSSLLLFFSPLLLPRFLSLSLQDESVVAREFLIQASFKIIQEHPFLGSGIYTFLPSLSHTVSPLSYNLLQPVHAVPLLIVAELGGLFALLFAVVCLWIGYKLFQQKAYPLLYLVLLVSTLSLFDHYFWTLQQGQLLFSFYLSLIFSQMKMKK